MYNVISVDELSPDTQGMLSTYYNFLELEKLLDKTIAESEEYQNQLLLTITHYCLKLSLTAQRISSSGNQKENLLTYTLLGQLADRLSCGVIGSFLKVNEK